MQGGRICIATILHLSASSGLASAVHHCVLVERHVLWRGRCWSHLIRLQSHGSTTANEGSMIGALATIRKIVVRIDDSPQEVWKALDVTVQRLAP